MEWSGATISPLGLAHLMFGYNVDWGRGDEVRYKGYIVNPYYFLFCKYWCNLIFQIIIETTALLSRTWAHLSNLIKSCVHVCACDYYILEFWFLLLTNASVRSCRVYCVQKKACSHQLWRCCPSHAIGAHCKWFWST